MFDVEVRNIHGAVTAVGAAGSFTVVIDRPRAVGGGGLGFNGAELLHLAVAGCISNDLFREADARGIVLNRVAIRAAGGIGGDPAVSTGVAYSVEVGGECPDEVLRDLVLLVDGIAEIPNSLRRGTEVRLVGVTVHAGTP